MDINLYLEEVGKRIMERRKTLGLTQEAFSTSQILKEKGEDEGFLLNKKV